MDNLQLSFASTCRWTVRQRAAGSNAAWPSVDTRRRLRTRLVRRGTPFWILSSALDQRALGQGRHSLSVAAVTPANPVSGAASSEQSTETTRAAPSAAPPSFPLAPLPTSSQPQPLAPSVPQQQQQLQPAAARRSRPRFRLLPEDPNRPLDRQLPEDNPSLDDIVLDEQYYKDMGLTPEYVQEALRQLDATELDPEGEILGLDGLPTTATSRGSVAGPVTPWSTRSSAVLPSHLEQPTRGPANGEEDSYDGEEAAGEEEDDGASADEGDLPAGSSGGGGTDAPPLLSPFELSQGFGEDEEVAYGPEAVVLAGFRAEELGVVRAILDSAGGHVVKVLPVTETMLYGTVDEAIHSHELDWAAPWPQDGPRGGGWGAQRTVLFSGLGVRAQLTVLELLEASGLPAVCAAEAREGQAARRLGEVLAEAVASQRTAANRLPKEEEPWRAAAATGRIADARRGLTPLEDLIGEKAQERLRQYDVGEEFGDAVAASAAPTSATASRAGAMPGGGGAAAGAELPVLDSFALKAAEAAEAEWAAWRAAKAAEASGWGLDGGPEEWGGGYAAADPTRALEAGLDPDSETGPSLADLGVDLEQLREQLLRQLSDLDADTLNKILVDSPYGDAAGEALIQWRRAQEEEDVREHGQASATGASAMAASASASPGPTVDDLQRLSERQRRRWQEAQERLESAAAAAGQLVLEAESSPLTESDQVPVARAAPAAPAATQRPATTDAPAEQRSGAASVPAAPAHSEGGLPVYSKARANPPASVGLPVTAVAAATAAAVAAATPAAASSPVRRHDVAGSGGSKFGAPRPHPPPQSASPSAPPARSPSAASARTAPQTPKSQHAGALPVSPTSEPSSEPAFDDLFGGGGSSFFELDDLLGQLAAPAAGGAAASRPPPPSPADVLFLSLKPGGTYSSSSSGPGALGIPFGAGDGFSGSSSGGGGGALQQVQKAARSGAAPDVIQRMLDEQYGTPAPSGGRVEEEALPPPEAAASAPSPPPEEPTAAAPQRRRGSLFAGLKSAKPPPPAGQGGQPPEEEQEGARQRPRRSYGPAPPPEPDPVMKPLLELRPDIARAMQEKKVQFMDLSRLNDKQKRQFAEHQARQRLEQKAQAQEAQMARQQQAQQRELQRQRGQEARVRQAPRQQQQQQPRRPQDLLRQREEAEEQRRLQQQQERQRLQEERLRLQQQLLMQGGPQDRQQPGQERKEEAGLWKRQEALTQLEGRRQGLEQQQQQVVYGSSTGGTTAQRYDHGAEEEDSYGDVRDDEEQEDEDEEGEEEDVLDADKLRQLVAASLEEGVSLEDTLAQAVAMGVRLDESVLRAAGVPPPSAEALARARAEYDRMFMEWAAEQGLAPAVRRAVEGQLAPDRPELGQDLNSDPNSESEDEQERASGIRPVAGARAGAATAGPMGSTPGGGGCSGGGGGGGGGSRPWGAGLAARRRRNVGSSS